ncbi:hypothetical protein AAE478_004826 [Parahypoxylon ruwenzoriense]
MDTMDLDVEMDVDVDLVPDEPIILEPEPQDTGNRSPGEVDEPPSNEDALVPSKVHIRGLDVMNPDEVKAYVFEHFSEESIERIEWIDDSSANLLFSSDSVAARALSSLAAEDIQDIVQLFPQKLVPAKRFSKKPDVLLQIRLAVATDKKQAGAATRSRFYLLNPEYDPEERRRRGEVRRYRERDGSGYGNRRTRDTRDREVEDKFDVSLYDDDEATLSRRTERSRLQRRRSYTPDTDSDRRERSSYQNDNRGKELFPNDPNGRNGTHRNRSASPIRDGDSDQAMDDVSSGGSAARNRDRAHTIKSRLSRSNRARELFPEKSASDARRLGDNVEDAATLLAKGITLPLMDGSSDVPAAGGGKLEDRIMAPRKDRLADRVSRGSTSEATSSVFNIRGTASQRSSDQGFAIKGSAGKSAKELFPEKFGVNSGKELFADRLEGRSRQRQRAGDLFD